MSKKTKLHINADNILGTFIMLLVVAIIVGLVAAECVNEGNKITTGVVVDKEYTAGYSTFGKEYGYHYYPASFELTIAGDKNGEYVEYTFEVCETEYMMYKIGDKYPKNEV